MNGYYVIMNGNWSLVPDCHARRPVVCSQHACVTSERGDEARQQPVLQEEKSKASVEKEMSQR